MKAVESTLTVISIFITAFSIVISLPGIFISPDFAISYLQNYSFPFRVILLLLIELSLGFGFGYLFYLVTYIDFNTIDKEGSYEDIPFANKKGSYIDKIKPKNYKINLFNPAILLLNLILVFLSAWVTFFNIDLLVASHITKTFTRLELLINFGVIISILEILILYSHVKKRYSYKIDLSFVIGAQIIAFLLMFLVFSETNIFKN